jgi:hypothetical protein
MRYCQLRKAGVRGAKLAFMMWWDTGTASTGARSFLLDVIGALARLKLGEMASRTVDLKDMATGTRLVPIAHLFGPRGRKVEFATVLGITGLHTRQGSLYAALQAREPSLAGLTSLAFPAEDIFRSLPPLSGRRYALGEILRPLLSVASDIIKPQRNNVVLLAYELVFRTSLKQFRQSLDEASSEDLIEIRSALRTTMACVLRCGALRQYWHRCRRYLVGWQRQVGTLPVPRSLAPTLDLLSREGFLAIVLLSLLHTRPRYS